MGKFKYFSVSEFACTHTGKNFIEQDLVFKLDELRGLCGFPFVITSGYRDATHPEEARKTKPGMHAQGIAADIKVSNGTQRALIVKHALELGFNGIGVAKTFVHVDTRPSTLVMWTY
jgi:uncharacterized protein YcbK (DUF882 family)